MCPGPAVPSLPLLILHCGMPGLSSSWIPVAEDSDFSLQNLPFGVFSTGADPTPRCGVALGHFVVDLPALGHLLSGQVDASVFARGELNAYMACDRQTWRVVRERLIDLLGEGGSRDLQDDEELRGRAIISMDQVTMHLPARIGDYTDFFTSRDHAYNCGCMFRSPENALNPNFLHLPVGYHGRASSVYVSGTQVVRPMGQVKRDDASVHIPTNALDFEMELGFFVGGPATAPGQVLSLEEAHDRIFGLVLLNDWSARDIQAWEYVPLGPFTAKNFATSISPWVVTLEALAPFRCKPISGPQTQPTPLAYLRDPDHSQYDINLQVEIKGGAGGEYSTVTRTNARNIYWSPKQMLAHHSVTGCRMCPGDLCGTGTISGKEESSFGCMLELSWNRSREVSLGEGRGFRHFLEDGDYVRMTGYCHAPGIGRVGFGECTGEILTAGTRLDPLDDVCDIGQSTPPFKAYAAAASAGGGHTREHGVPSEPTQKGFIVGFSIGLVAASCLVWLLGTSQLNNRA